MRIILFSLATFFLFGGIGLNIYEANKVPMYEVEKKCEPIVKKSETHTKYGEPKFFVHTKTMMHELSAYDFINRNVGDQFCRTFKNRTNVSSFTLLIMPIFFIISIVLFMMAFIGDWKD